MLNEVLENSKNELMQIIQKSEGLQTRKIKLEEEMQETKEAILSLNQENRGLSIYRKRNPIVEFFMKTFSKQYKQELKTSANNTKKLKELNEKMANLRSEKRKLDLDEQTLNPERAKGQLEKMENTDVAIHMLVNEKPEITKNPEFMKDLINRNMQYIEYDNSNEPELYMQYIEKMIQKLEEAKERPNANEFTINMPINTAKKILEELNSPKEVEKGKYKIPRRLLAKNAEEPIWNSDFPEADIQHPGYISPEYVYGYINPDTEEIEENTIPISDRKKYKYQFLNGQTTCVDDRIKY